MTAEDQEQSSEWQTEKESLLAKIKELKSEKMKLKAKYEDIDPDIHSKLIDENESLKSELSKVKKLYDTDIKRVNEENEKTKAFIHKSVLTDGLGKALLEAGVDQKFLPAAQAMLEKQAKVVQNGDDYSALIGDVPANDFVKSWMENEGKIFTMVTPDQGAGARGGSQGGGDRVVSIKDAKTPEERRAAIEARIKQ